MDKKVVIVVLNYKNYQDTIECIKSIKKITYKNYEVVVVDNKSENDSLSYIADYLRNLDAQFALIDEAGISNAQHIKEKIILLQSSKNGGYAAGNNLGIRVGLERAADYLMILNNDTVVTSGFLEPLVRYANEYKKVGVIGPKVLDVKGDIEYSCARRHMTMVDYIFLHNIMARLFPDNRWIRRHIYKGEYDFKSPKIVDVLSGCCMLFNAKFFSDGNLLDENTFLFYEEFIIYEKIRAAGYISVINPDSVIIHKHGKSTSTRSLRIIENYLLDSGKYYFINYRRNNKYVVGFIISYADFLLTVLRSIKRLRNVKENKI
jgi:GT2 family glycosyltransferase